MKEEYSLIFMKRLARHILIIPSLLCLGALAERLALGAGYAPAPNDTYFLEQWYLENLGTNGVRAGIDINAREAWSMSKGAGVTIAIVDDGIEILHPDLAPQIASSLNWHFESGTPDGNHPTDFEKHGTPLAGLAAAAANNGRGVSGMAPDARLASWIIYKTNGTFIPADQMAAMFQFHKDDVQIQNHSWTRTDFANRVAPMSDQENLAISNAVTLGRGGKGTIIVRAGGNDRLLGRNANDQNYISDPRAIAVAAVRLDGRFASYSNPGACLLVGAPSGDITQGFPNLFTTDRLGKNGYNGIGFTNDLADYVFAGLGFSGTSASAPLISGVAALMLSANPNLSYRDVQQILIHSSRQTGPPDPDVLPNGAGYPVSHNTGFGLVDAGWAVELAQNWKSRPAATSVSYSVTETKTIPEAGLRVLTSNSGLVPTNLPPLIALPTMGVHPDSPTPVLPLIYIGTVTQELTINLTGKGALIQRGGGVTFPDKLMRATRAGAAFAIVFNNQGDGLLVMGDTDMVPIPAVFIGQTDGNALLEFITNNPDALAQLKLEEISYAINVPDTLLCEHVGLRVKTTHQRRGDVRITLVSPKGTRSVMQRFGADDAPGPVDWTYWSTHHFYEPSAGTWTVHISDEFIPNTGAATYVELTVNGVPILDLDNDGLDDTWELTHFLSLQYGPADDPDHDGLSNAREQILGTPPNKNNRELALSITQWYPGYVRLSWPATDGLLYDLRAAPIVNSPFATITTLPGQLPRSSVILPTTESTYSFLRVLQESH